MRVAVVRWMVVWIGLFAVPDLFLLQTPAQVHASDNGVMRIVTANLTSGPDGEYSDEGINILKGLHPDICAIQEFKYRWNTTNDIREMVNRAFAPDFHYFREPGFGYYAMPNGIVSRWPILSSGVWADEDPRINNRGFVWAQIDIPGPTDLYFVSVHFNAGDLDAGSRAGEARQLKRLILEKFPPDSFIIAAGDYNIGSQDEESYRIMTSFLNDDPVPADPQGNRNTNRKRFARYDYIFTSANLTRLVTSVKMPSRSFPGGLVFDSNIYKPLSDVPPANKSDSKTPGMQHMAVVKDFLIK